MSLLHKKQSLDILRSNNTEFNSQVISPLCIWMHGPDNLLVSVVDVAAGAVGTGVRYHYPSSWSVQHGQQCGLSARPLQTWSSQGT